jgi:hypothetical protein
LKESRQAIGTIDPQAFTILKEALDLVINCMPGLKHWAPGLPNLLMLARDRCSSRT